MDPMMRHDGPWHGARRGSHPIKLALPLAAFGAARLARGGGRRGPSPLPFILPLALFGASRLAMAGGGRRGGPFGPGGPHRGGPFGEGHDEEGGNPFGGNPFGRRGPVVPPFGSGFPFGGGPFGRARRARRGDVRAGIIALLHEEPRNGYQIIQELGQRSGGAWRPSPGSVYPALQQLEDEGLVRAEETDGKRTFTLTDAGRAYVESHREEVAAPWDTMAEGIDTAAREIGGMIQQVAVAAMQVVHTGNRAQLAEARKLLANTRRGLYRILAEDEQAEGDASPEQL